MRLPTAPGLFSAECITDSSSTPPLSRPRSMTFAIWMNFVAFLRAIFSTGASTEAVCASPEPATHDCECAQTPESAAQPEKAPLQASEAKTPSAAVAVLVSARRPVGCNRGYRRAHLSSAHLGLPSLCAACSLRSWMPLTHC
jgi:hypothetical protein